MQKAIKKSWKEEWIKCRPLIAKAIKYQDSYTIDDIEAKIDEGIFLLWAGQNSAFVTEFVVFPQHTAMNLLFCGGNYQELEAMLPHIEDYAKACGVKRLYGGGRKGWTRKLKHLGFETEYLIRKDL